MENMAFDKIYLVGNGRIAGDCLRILSKRQIPVMYIEVFEETFSFTAKLCERLEIPFLHIDKGEMKSFLLGIEEETLIFSVHNSYIFPKEVVEKDNLTILNMHIALLPKYRGMNAPTWEIYEQEENAGVTWHEISASIDAGGIIVQSSFSIGEDDTAMQVLQSSFRAGVDLFDQELDAFISKNYRTRMLDNSNTRLYLNKELPNDGYLDDDWDYKKTYAFLRSLDYSGANLMRLPRIRYDNKVYEIIKYKKDIVGEMSQSRTVEYSNDNIILRWGGYSLICSIRELMS